VNTGHVGELFLPGTISGGCGDGYRWETTFIVQSSLKCG